MCHPYFVYSKWIFYRMEKWYSIHRTPASEEYKVFQSHSISVIVDSIAEMDHLFDNIQSNYFECQFEGYQLLYNISEFPLTYTLYQIWIQQALLIFQNSLDTIAGFKILDLYKFFCRNQQNSIVPLFLLLLLNSKN